MMRRIAPGLALAAVIVGLIVAYQTAAVSSRTGSGSPVYSIRRHDPYGTAALSDLLAERGAAVRMLERPSLEQADRGVLIQVLPVKRWTSGDRFRVQTKQLAEWIAQGNTVVQFSRGPTDLMMELKLVPSSAPADAETVEDFETGGGMPDRTPARTERARWTTAQSDNPALRALDGKSLLLQAPMPFAAQSDPAWKPLATLTVDGKVEVVAAEYRTGKGRLILIGAPTPALNGALAEEANLDFLLAAIGKSPVIVDEWSHGVGHEATIIGFLHDAGLVPILFQLAFLAGLYVWSTSGFRRPAELPAPRQRSSIEQIETLGFLYSRAMNPDVTFERINVEVQRRLAEGLRCQPREIKARMAALTPALRAKFEQLFERLNGARPAHGPRCQACGYELYMNTTGRCPECGKPIPPLVRQQLASTTETPSGVERRRSTRDTIFAEVLSFSHDLTKEVQRERRGSR